MPCEKIYLKTEKKKQAKKNRNSVSLAVEILYEIWQDKLGKLTDRVKRGLDISTRMFHYKGMNDILTNHI